MPFTPRNITTAASSNSGLATSSALTAVADRVGVLEQDKVTLTARVVVLETNYTTLAGVVTTLTI